MKSPEPPAELPDDTSRAENQAVSTDFLPSTEKTTKRAVIIFALALLVCFGLVKVLRLVGEHALSRETQSTFAAPPPVDVAVARAASAGQLLTLPGQTAAWYETTIYARVSGYVARWQADIGDHVSKGQVLASIETPELDAQLTAARAELRASEAVVSARRAEAEFSRTTNERWRDSPKGVVSEQERQAKKADYDSAQARLYAAEAQVTLDRAHVEQYLALTHFKEVVAPFDGTVTERRIDIGNLVSAGSASTTTPLYRMAQSDPLRVFVDVPQGAAAELMRTGLPAEISSTQGGERYQGRIARSAGALSAGARTMRVEVDMPNAAHALLPGMYVNVGFTLAPKGAVQVPAAALIYRSTGPQVARVDSDNKISFDAVRIARDDGGVVELASGVKAGDRLVLNISSQIGPGQRVTVNDAGQPALVSAPRE